METKSGVNVNNNKIIYLYMCLYKICDCDWFPLCLFVMQMGAVMSVPNYSCLNVTFTE